MLAAFAHQMGRGCGQRALPAYVSAPIHRFCRNRGPSPPHGMLPAQTPHHAPTGMSGDDDVA